MKSGFLTCLICFTYFFSFSQIEIVRNDIADAGDTILVSNIDGAGDVDYEIADSNYTWNYYDLQFNDQSVKRFEEVFETGFIYAGFFADLPFNPNRANVADEGNLSLPALITASDAYNFYDRNNDEFKQVGIGATLNGIETPYRFINDDIIYPFPLRFRDRDTSFSNYTFRIPSLAGYGYKQTRFNEVDGYGILITPFDTFEVIRLKSIIRGRDSLYIDSLGFGFEFDRPLITEYKWLAKDKKIPVLQFTTQTVFGNSFVTEAFYQDTIRVPNAVAEKRISILKIFPNPAHKQLTIQYQNANDKPNIRLYNLEGKEYAIQVQQQQNSSIVSWPQLSTGGWHLLQIETPTNTQQQLILIIP